MGTMFNNILKKAKLRLLRMHYESGVGHIGGNLSALDAMLYLHLEKIKKDDTFVLSKGHAAGALYITLWIMGKISDHDLKMFHKDNTKLSGHPVAGWLRDIPFSTGSLGHGLSLAAGRAKAKKIINEPGEIFCLMSDGEWQEGSNWEALIFIVHHCLNNLTVLIDMNGLQGFGKTSDIGSLDPLMDKFRPFRVDVQEIDGHDPAALHAALEKKSERPRIILLRTIKGHGVSFMEGRMEWHYLPITEKQYELAIQEISAS